VVPLAGRKPTDRSDVLVSAGALLDERAVEGSRPLGEGGEGYAEVRRNRDRGNEREWKNKRWLYHERLSWLIEVNKLSLRAALMPPCFCPRQPPHNTLHTTHDNTLQHIGIERECMYNS
jgi:hypothetical protein